MERIYDCSVDTDLLTGMRLAKASLGRHELVVLPTDTVYGIGCDAFSAKGVAALLAAKLTDCHVLLKGNINWMASPNQKVRALGPMSAHLATAGTGDVLAGALAALLAANHIAVLESEEVFLDVIELAVELHSRAAELASQDGPVSALDVAESLRKAIAEIS